ncbi:50S ribosomal protein L25/general stress protein Ctc [Pseudoclavibacter chungangensis]|uniref:Large ribosomal subunit protein bL25 n=1 Tax=Pseudoclavibacter chungangensis TaxID=587635 RepID=A0A7J5BUH3_9MICO|nr:50S ribosomal protein L25/general stress protein Ctc [Pseudoclavibacter chungangensis]KAB1657962.1 50S ribosomal protein L25/general stress protein Ctc [Pseudoclavibacter chungangensis]NYJ65884.1 large subunit ribosomal protein L25 [Pseudoclavibacter chungangensis]
MVDQNTLSVEVREHFGKGAARKIRALDKIPAVLYGHGTDPRHLTLPGHETMLILRKANAVITLDIAGDEQLALVKDVQRDPVRRIIEHVDLVVVRKGERVEVEVPVHLEGESFAGTIAVQDATSILVSAEATNIPESVVVSIEGLEEGTSIHATQVELPAGVELVGDETEIIIVSIQTPQLEEELEESEAEDGAAEADAE